jgi:hypothetical protein
MTAIYFERVFAVLQSCPPVRVNPQVGFGWTQYLTIGIAFSALVVSGLTPFLSFKRRPDLSLVKDEDGIHTRPEITGPAVRLLVRNSPRRRVAHGAQVLVEYYRQNTRGSERVPLGQPKLLWPSLPSLEAAQFIFAGSERPVDFGVFELMNPRTSLGGPPISAILPVPESLQNGAVWCFHLRLAIPGNTPSFREYLYPVPAGYVATLTVGADDGASHRYDVTFNWDAQASDADALLASLQKNLTVQSL